MQTESESLVSQLNTLLAQLLAANSELAAGFVHKCRPLLEISSDIAVLQRIQARSLYFLANEMRDRGKIVEACDYVLKACTADPQLYAARFLAGCVLFENEASIDDETARFEAALEHMQACVDNQYRAPAALVHCARILERLNKPWLAVQQLQRSLELEAANVTAVYDVALLYGKLQKFDMQYTVLQYAIKLIEQLDHRSDVCTMKVLYAYGRAAARLKDWTVAVSSFKQLVDAVSASIGEQHSFGVPLLVLQRQYVYCLLQDNQTALAAQECSKALARAAGDPILTMFYADCRLSQHNSQPALEDIIAVLSILDSVEPTSTSTAPSPPKRHRINAPTATTLLYCDRLLQNSDYRTQLRAQLLNNKAYLLLSLKRPDEALVALQSARALQPNAYYLPLIFNITLVHLKRDSILAACLEWMQYRQIPLQETRAHYEQLQRRASLASRGDNKLQIIPNCHVNEAQCVALDKQILERWMEMYDTNRQQQLVAVFGTQKPTTAS
eukprot:TRINITY_DN10553_c0_g1_i2.p1 TRINITY_DN10553_c0_g1~~TRINITY_DN10553_c0_g1_i2.p1  ORF type:complete len:500 (+),score=135.82 TRINITY_DN10553_c0_g1_i2:66-1565(+)